MLYEVITLGRQVLIGELAADEWARLIVRSDSLDPPQGGQEEPLVVGALAVGVAEEGGSAHVAGLVEDDEQLVAVVGDFQGA